MNDKRQLTNQQLFIELANPDESGVSRIVFINEFVGKYDQLKFGNGGSWARMDGSGSLHKYHYFTIKKLKKYIVYNFTPDFPQDLKYKYMKKLTKWEKNSKRLDEINYSNAIIAIKLCGEKNDVSFSRQIAFHIKDHFTPLDI